MKQLSIVNMCNGDEDKRRPREPVTFLCSKLRSPKKSGNNLNIYQLKKYAFSK